MCFGSGRNYGLRTLFSGLPLEPIVIVPSCWVLNRAGNVRFHSISHISPTPCLVCNTLSFHHIALCVILCMRESVHTYWKVKSKCWLIICLQSNMFALTENHSLETAQFLFPLNPPSFLYLALIHPDPHSIFHLHARRTESGQSALCAPMANWAWLLSPPCIWSRKLMESFDRIHRGCQMALLLLLQSLVRRNFFSNDRSRV